MNHEKLLDVLEDMHWAAINIKHPEIYIDSTKEELSEALKQLREIVERDTPKKGVRKIDEIYGSEDCYCPCCDAYLEPPYELSNFCPDCGQRLDWSE